jgi:hypothetical protein
MDILPILFWVFAVLGLCSWWVPPARPYWGVSPFVLVVILGLRVFPIVVR